MENVGISLGWNCASAVWGVENNVRQRKRDGYLTCPFDEMMSNYDGVIQCIDDDFENFCDPQHLQVKKIPAGLPYVNYHDYCDELIVNTKYNFAFNHESPGHPFLCQTQGWSKGKYHYTAQGYSEFILRYKRRIENFRNYLKDPKKKIFFILSRWQTRQQDIHDLHSVIKKRHPSLVYEIIILDSDKQSCLNDLKVMGVSADSGEIKRLL